MNLFEKILESEFKLTLYANKINVVNYKKLEEITNTKVIVATDDKIIEILGEDLILNKLLNKEVLVTGNIKKIQVI